MADEALLGKVRRLGDLELAALLSLIAREHCLISTVPEAVDELVDELRLVATDTFRLAPVVVACHAHTTLDDFATALLLPPSPRSVSPPRPHADHTTGGSYFSSRRSAYAAYSPTTPASSSTAAHTQSQGRQAQIGNVVLAKNLDRAPKAVQIQALELLRTRRIFTRTAVQIAPKQFLFVAVVGAASGGQARVTPHLNDYFYIAHWHDPEDGFAHLDQEGEEEEEEEAVEWGGGGKNDRNKSTVDDDESASTTSSKSVLKKRSAPGPSRTMSAEDPRENRGASSRVQPYEDDDIGSPLTEGDIAHLAQMGQRVLVDVDVLRYQTNIASFLRMHRAVAGGITPTATKHLEQLAKSLAPLHGLDYVTPSLVALAAKKIYLHRIHLATPDKERSMQWGSELAAIEVLLEGVGPEDVIEDILGMVGVPQ